MNAIEGRISPMVEGFTTDRPAAQLLLKRVTAPHWFGVAVLADHGRITRLLEKPQDPPSDLARVGMYLFMPAIRDAAERIVPSARGSWRSRMRSSGLDDGLQVRASEVAGWWLGTGKKDKLLDANRIGLDTLTQGIDGTSHAGSEMMGMVVGAGAEVVRSTVRGPAIIGEGARVTDAYIGQFTPIRPGCVIESCEVEYSVVMERASGREVGRIEGSLLDRDVTIARGSRRPAAYRFPLGDHAEVEL